MSSTLLSLSKKGIRSRSSVSDMSSNQEATGTWRFEEAGHDGITDYYMSFNSMQNVLQRKKREWRTALSGWKM